MKTSDFDYSLPPELIAQTPIEPRDHSRLLVLNRADGSISHRHFFDLPEYLKPGDVLVFNDSRVIPARLMGRKVGSGGKIEILLLRRFKPGEWEALVKPGSRVKTGICIEVLGRQEGAGVMAEVVGMGEGGVRAVRFSDEAALSTLGAVALPPYIHTPLPRPERYQTVYARNQGSVAAPTAGLHFTPELLDKIGKMGVQCLFVTLHIGMDTFIPVREEDPHQHKIHSEYASLSPAVAQELSRARAEGRRIIAVGTTSVRILEQAALSGTSPVQPFEGAANLFILPGHDFRLVDSIITNFHLPKSTLLMLVSAFAGTDFIRCAYAEAINRRYRFYSFGDAMLVI